ncbi:MAG TPA: DUF3142 domain-containing protein [Pyrinomonadaceae bacterium]|nr:DUF3142 domain-containing protein [Pyrinomonadaceae bacterium]
MSRKQKLLTVILSVTVMLSVVALSLSISCRTTVETRERSKTNTRNRFDEIRFPNQILWAWERPEQLEFLDSQHFAVAFLAQTLVLKNDDVEYKPRRQPLKVKPDTKLIAVTRIESQKQTGLPTALSATQKQKLIDFLLKTAALRNVSAIQIDFDAARSEREFYRDLLQELRQKLPDNIPLSMTALASFCVGDRWLDDLPVDEAVPMIFRMGADSHSIRTFLTSGNDFHEPLCRRSYGIALDEPIAINFDRSRRQYIFNVRPWTEQDILTLQQEVHK